MILGIVGSATGLMCSVTLLKWLYKKYGFKKWVLIISIIFITLCVVFGAMGGFLLESHIDNINVKKYYYEFLATKETYESIISNQNLNGLERFEISKVALENNKYLAVKKVDMQEWYSWYISEENKALILNLEFIGINKV